MTKVAIFVEGHTEEALVEAVVVALAGSNPVGIEVRRQHKGSLTTIATKGAIGATARFVLLVNCCNDGAVLSQIRDRYQDLEHAGYTRIIGLRDVHPVPPLDSALMISAVLSQLPSGSVPTSMHFAQREVESWFLQESTHFVRIDPKLTRNLIAQLGFDPFDPKSNAETILAPAEHLKNVYQLVKKSYTKSAKHRARTIDALSIDELYFTVRERLPSLNEFLTAIEDGLFPA